MRELKFRAWDKIAKKYYKVVNLGVGPNSWQKLAENRTEPPYQPDTGKNKFYPGIVEVEQYTGLNDKNGKEIYEGDIIHRGALPKVNVFRNSVIRFDEESVGFIATSTRNGARTLFNGHTCDEIEVIGNIHGNPELLSDTNVTNKEEEWAK